MAEAAISFTVQNLGDFLIAKVGFLKRVEEEVKSLKDELARMQCFLKDAGKKQSEDESVRKWISDIRDVAQDADDAIEIFIVKVGTKGLLRRICSFPKHLYHINKVGKEIESIQKRLQAIESSRQRYRLQDLGEGAFLPRRSDEVELRRRLAPWQKDKDVVGLEQDVESLLSKAILDGKKGLSVVSIIGMGGIGKSTLARFLYNHPKVVDRFRCRAWVVIPREFSPKVIIKELIRQVLGPSRDTVKLREELERSDVHTLQEKLHKHLQDRRYFIVLDDVWEQAHWEHLQNAFPEGDKASRLLITSRKRGIPRCARDVHELKTLDPKKSWELFLKKVFIDNTNGKCPNDLENLGREILKECDGLPLAITMVGGLMARLEKSKSKWEKVLRGMKSNLARDENGVSTVLELSYLNLPPQLKSCFMCLGFFKEDAIIRAEKLVEMWIALGLISQGGGEETMEEIARGYLDELINQNMVQVQDVSKDGRVKSCHIHDLLRELSIRKAKEEMSFEILKEVNAQSSNKPRHRAMYCSSESFADSRNPNQRLRSLFFYGGGSIDSSPSYWRSLELLRVLDFEDFGLRNLPHTIGELLGLKYLGLRNNNLEKLPSSLSRLKKLQVLDIAKNHLVEVPNIIWKMDSLRHLYMSRITPKAALKIRALKNLQTLNYIPLAHRTPKDLSTKMTGLRKLGIEEIDENSDISKLCHSLAKLENLVCLNLIGKFSPMTNGLGKLHCLTKLKLRGVLTELPNASDFPPNLSYLSLTGSSLVEDPMPVLEKLPSLSYLKLDDAYHGEEMVVSPEGFPSIKVLSLRQLQGLKNINVANGAMPQLKRLQIYNCPALESLPRKLRKRGDLEIETYPEISRSFLHKIQFNFAKLAGLEQMDVKHSKQTILPSL